MIPPTIIRCVPADTPPSWETYWQRWIDLHPDWNLVTARDPIDPADWPLLGRYHRYATSGAQLAGMVRLEAVWRWGGFYVDADLEPLRSLHDLRVHPLVICTEDGTHLTDAFFGAERQHPGLTLTIEHVAGLYDHWLHTGAGEDSAPGAQTTGPLATTNCLSRRPDVTILAQRCFYPYSYLEPERAGEDFATTSPESYAVHRWSFTWKDT